MRVIEDRAHHRAFDKRLALFTQRLAVGFQILWTLALGQRAILYHHLQNLRAFATEHLAQAAIIFILHRAYGLQGLRLQLLAGTHSLLAHAQRAGHALVQLGTDALGFVQARWPVDLAHQYGLVHSVHLLRSQPVSCGIALDRVPICRSAPLGINALRTHRTRVTAEHGSIWRDHRRPIHRIRVGIDGVGRIVVLRLGNNSVLRFL